MPMITVSGRRGGTRAEALAAAADAYERALATCPRGATCTLVPPVWGDDSFWHTHLKYMAGEDKLAQCRNAAASALHGIWAEETMRVLGQRRHPGQGDRNVKRKLPELTDHVLREHFADLVNREAHLRQIFAAIKEAWLSDFQSRHHVLLHGDPAAGKWILLKGMASFLGEDLVWMLDASTTSKAGLERQLLYRAKKGTLPPYVFIEEIDKAPKTILSGLLQVMDERARIQRTNALGDETAEVRSLVLATCNDLPKMQRDALGRALLSRFAVQVPCHRPNQADMYAILAGYALKEGIDERCVDVVLDFMFGELARFPQFRDRFDDPRLGKFLLAGREHLLDEPHGGSFLADYRTLHGIPVPGVIED